MRDRRWGRRGSGCAGRRHAGGGGIRDDHGAAGRNLNLTGRAEDVLAADEREGLGTRRNGESVLSWNHKNAELRAARKDRDAARERAGLSEADDEVTCGGSRRWFSGRVAAS